MEFNEAQMRAVNHKEGPAMVLAGPGSGKTTVITHRVKKLIEGGVSPEKIMVVTFTKAAAVHMQKKFFSIMSGENWIKGSYPVTFGTFHSIYFRILKLSGRYKSENILSTKMQNDIIREIVIRKKIEAPSMCDFAQGIVGEIGNIKGNMIPPEEYNPLCCEREKFKIVYEEYEKELAAGNKIDFDDILLKCYEMLKNNRELCEKWQEIFEYILVDEFQDINRVQYEIIKLLAEPQNNIFIVGDDDQSIYGFRGACPEIMFDFEKDYVEVERILLNVNYRSKKEIVKLSENLIKNNIKRFDKNIVSANGEGLKPDVRKFETQYDELMYVCELIKNNIEKGVPPKEIAILVRNNSQIPVIKNILKENSVSISGGKTENGIYENGVGKDIISYIKAAMTYKNVELGNNADLIYILNKPARLVSRQIISKENMNFTQLKKIYGHNAESLKCIRKLEFDLNMISKLNPGAAFLYIKNGVGYEKYLEDYAREKKIKSGELKKQLETIRRDSGKYETLKEWVEGAEKKDTEQKTKKEIDVNIMTMHSAKGLEFEIVIIVDVIQGIIPTSKAVREREFEEERRLFYVAVTRAKSILGIYTIEKSLGCEVDASMFINESIE
ncbi:ATP-dependent helicase [uncultured Eubacterium sp.]|uniref:ATP-dependent helicase n=1 Tax=uncultured Eubacterium sp. TaxID=165185 RepID=UPI0026721DC3|nr:ATP-dependent helicase [uncultured Eubacterium sp.]